MYCGGPLLPKGVLPWGPCCQARVRYIRNQDFSDVVKREAKIEITRKIIKHQIHMIEEGEVEQARAARRKHQLRPHARKHVADAPLRRAA